MAAIHTQDTSKAIVDLTKKLESQVDGYKLDEASASSESLYHKGLDLVKREFTNDPLEDEGLYTRTVVHVQQVLPRRDIQDNHLIHRTLLRTHSVFLELLWYRKWNSGKRKAPTLPDTIEDVTKVAEQLRSMLPKEPELRGGVMFSPESSLFDIDCSLEAAKQLSPPKKDWRSFRVYLSDMKEALSEYKEALAGASIASICPPLAIGVFFTPAGFKVIKAVCKLIKITYDYTKEIRNQITGTWYHDVWNLRWLSANIESPDQFEEILQPLLTEFCMESDRHSVCVASILYDIIVTNPGDTEDKKKLLAMAFTGGGNYMGLAELVNFEVIKRRDRLPGFHKGSRRYKTRQVATYCLTALLQKVKVDRTLIDQDLLNLGLSVIQKRLRGINEATAHDVEGAAEYYSGVFEQYKKALEEMESMQTAVGKLNSQLKKQATLSPEYVTEIENRLLDLRIRARQLEEKIYQYSVVLQSNSDPRYQEFLSGLIMESRRKLAGVLEEKKRLAGEFGNYDVRGNRIGGTESSMTIDELRSKWDDMEQELELIEREERNLAEISEANPEQEAKSIVQEKEALKAFLEQFDVGDASAKEKGEEPTKE